MLLAILRKQERVAAGLYFCHLRYQRLQAHRPRRAGEGASQICSLGFRMAGSAGYQSCATLKRKVGPCPLANYQ